MAQFRFNGLRATLGQDPEVKTFPNGDIFTIINLAANKNWKDKDGEWQSRPTWLRCQITRDYLVEKAMALQKGDSISVEGLIDSSTVEKDGKERTYTNYEIVAFEKLQPKDND